MGYNVRKRLSLLKSQVDDDNVGKWGFVKALLLVTFVMAFFWPLILPSSRPQVASEVDSQTALQADIWQENIRHQFYLRRNWLKNSPLALSPGGSELYEKFGEAVVSSLDISYPEGKEVDFDFLDFASLGVWLNRSLCSALLRIGFVLIGFWPFWLLSALGAFFVIQSGVLRKESLSLLGVCDRKKSPFYSGIYGPFRPNNSFSGSDFSCPGLACPPRAKESVALNHKLVSLLKQSNAFNQTNLGLVEIILAHADFPGLVEEENFYQEEPETVDPAFGLPERASSTGFVSNDRCKLEQRALCGLPAVLDAHQRLVRYVKSLEARGVKSSALNSNYPAHIENLEKLTANSSPLVKLLITSITPNRIWALAHLDPAVVASAYLAIEAGKCLVFKRHGQAFARISIFPHLQARAVIHSLPEYHQDYKGDTRLIIRQAIICSRRHGDFGRAFLPNRMPIESRVLRDWLEILYADPVKEDDTARLVELDAHIEEVSVNWRIGLSTQLKKEAEGKDPLSLEAAPRAAWKGIVYKSVVLMPIRDLLKIALRGIPEERRKRISWLLAATRKYQTEISISARLPGFRRQAMEADKSGEDSDAIIQALSSAQGGKALIENWRIVRRMLTRYNWLSTRVGDDAVPLAGLISGVVCEEGKKEERLSALVPLRQRRFAELFGRAWEHLYYAQNPNPEDVEIFVDRNMYLEVVGKDTEGADSDNSSLASG